MSLASRLVTVCTSVAMLLVCAQTAQAACTSSTPAHTAFADSPADASGGAELTTVTVRIDAACTFSVDPGIAPDSPGALVITMIDRDGNPSTGSPSPAGADVAVASFGETEATPWIGVWNGTDFDIVGDATRAGPGGFSATVDQLGIVSGASTSTWVMSASLIADDEEEEPDVDFAPEPEAGAGIALQALFQTAATPGAPGTPAAPVAPGSSPTTGGPPARCMVPKVKGRSRAAAEARLRARGCAPAATTVRRYSAGVRKGRVIGTTPGTGRQTARPVTLIISKGRRPGQARPTNLAKLVSRLR